MFKYLLLLITFMFFILGLNNLNSENQFTGFYFITLSIVSLITTINIFYFEEKINTLIKDMSRW